MSRQERFQTYYDQLKTELTTTYGTHFPPLDHSNPDHRETLKDCASQRITLGQENFLIAWRQVLDKTEVFEPIEHKLYRKCRKQHTQQPGDNINADITQSAL